MPKIVFVGGGSVTWTPRIAQDLFLTPALEGSELTLVDIDTESLELLKVCCERLAEAIGVRWTVTTSLLDPALDGADVVTVSISTGGLEAMAKDYHFPEEFGVYHTVADTVGPGGISRTLRNVPVFVDIARKMEARCPEAWLIHVTNPLSQLTRAVCRESSIRCVGLCHNYEGTMAFLARYFGASRAEMDALTVGVNHFTWLKDITLRGDPVENQLSLSRYLRHEAVQEGPVESNTTDDEIEAGLGNKMLRFYLNFELFERFGHFPVGGSSHVAENFPHYLNSPESIERHHIFRKGVLPRREEMKQERRAAVLDIVEGRADLSDLKRSREMTAGIIESLFTDHSSRAIVAAPNRGQVSNLPRDVVVETWAHVSRSGIAPILSGPIPHPLAGSMQTIVDEEELAVEAALTGDRDKVVQAMAVSPLLADKDAAPALADRLLEAHKDMLPQFPF